MASWVDRFALFVMEKVTQLGRSGGREQVLGTGEAEGEKITGWVGFNNRKFWKPKVKMSQ